MPTNRVFLRGALILGAATIITKVLGSVYTVLLQNLIGDRGMGLYQMAYPVYATLLIISTAGFPVAVSKFVSEYAAIGDLTNARKVHRVSLILLTCLGFGAACLLYVSAVPLARLSGDVAAAGAIEAIAPALCIVPAMSCMRGYFQGWQIMNPTAISQIGEQMVRVITILAGAFLVIHYGYGESAAAAAAAFGAVTGGAAGLVMMLYFMWRYRQPARVIEGGGVPRVPSYPAIRTRVIVRKMVYYALPVSLGALIVPLMNNVDALTVTNLLKASGVSQALATREFGLLAGRAFKLMMFPAALASSVGAALMPSVSQAFARQDRQDTSARVLSGIRITLLFALPASAGLAVLAQPIDIALFRDAAGYHSIQWIGFATLFCALQIALAASLQGIGAVYLPLRSLAIGTGLKIALNFLLVPVYGIDGAAFATAVGYASASGLNWYALVRHLQMKISWTEWFVKPLCATGVMSAFAFGILSQWERMSSLLPGRLGAMAVTAVGIVVAAIVYGLMLVVLGSIGEREVSSFPKLGVPLARVCRRMGLFS